jgi:hypothetical protein
VTLSGANFAAGTVVYLGGAPGSGGFAVSTTVSSPTSLSFSVPSMPAGTYTAYIVVVNASGAQSMPADLKVDAATATPTTAPTAVGDGTLEIDEHRCYPNPVIGAALGNARVSVHVRGRADRLVLKLYSRAMTCLGSREVSNTSGGWVQIALPESFVNDAGAGTYFYVVSGERGQARTVQDAVGRVVVLR